MTPEQTALYIKILQFGFATGSPNRWDCLKSYLRAYPDQETEAISAAAAFERGCGYCPEQSEHLAGMSDQQYADWVDNFNRVQKAAKAP